MRPYEDTGMFDPSEPPVHPRGADVPSARMGHEIYLRCRSSDISPGSAGILPAESRTTECKHI
jgi:hypothetical protein